MIPDWAWFPIIVLVGNILLLFLPDPEPFIFHSRKATDLDPDPSIFSLGEVVDFFRAIAAERHAYHRELWQKVARMEEAAGVPRPKRLSR